jgi:hydroxymethylpyrimidine pyrophosphatase-like HAD family hydrolase
MRYLALATDYDGTIATHGAVDARTLERLRDVRAAGRKLVLVTGRELPDLERVFPHFELFDSIVAENGGLLYTPHSRRRRVLGTPPPAALVAELRARGVAPLSVGDSIVATCQPHETVVLEVIRELGLELQVIFNKGAVMIVPAGINKATGLAAALGELLLSAHNAVAIGDAENDHALLESVEISAAVANAVPMLKAGADIVTQSDHGAGVVELIEELLANDLANRVSKRPQRSLQVGWTSEGKVVSLPSQGPSILVAGTSGSGKSTLSTVLLEQLMSRGYQCCVIDPEGDYDELPGALQFGTAERAPDLIEIMIALERPDASVVINLLAVALHDRPTFFAGLLSRLQEVRAIRGHPHWILVDEAHHLLPAAWQPAPAVLAQELHSIIYVTIHPDHVSGAIRAGLTAIAALGEEPHRVFEVFGGDAQALKPVRAQVRSLEAGEALFWSTTTGPAPLRISISRSSLERRRHRRKYAKGDLGADQSFFFRGPDNRLNLRAQNLTLFAQIADGVDDETWLHHLRGHDYSQWIERSIKDENLLERVKEVEAAADELPAAESRARIKSAIEELYTLPASGVSGSA